MWRPAIPACICLHQSHQGLAAARNTGIDASKGELLVFLDADDRLLPKALEAGLECLRAHPECGFVFGEHKTVAGRRRAARGPRASPRCMKTSTSSCCRTTVWPCTGPCSFGARRCSRSASTIRTQRASEDYDLCLRMSRRFPVAWHSSVVAEYWKHEGNMSRDSGLMLRESLRALRKQRRQLKIGGRARGVPGGHPPLAALLRRGSVGGRHAQPQGEADCRGGQGRRSSCSALHRRCSSLTPRRQSSRTGRAAREGDRVVAWTRSFTRQSRDSRRRDARDSGGASRFVRTDRYDGADAGPTAPVPPVILLYHRVADVDSDPWNLAVSPRNFRDQMRVLAEEGSVHAPERSGAEHRQQTPSLRQRLHHVRRRLFG